MRALELNDAIAVSGGMIGGGSGPNGVPLLSMTVDQMMETIVVTASRMDGGWEFEVTGSFWEGLQTGIADCANGGQVGGILGGAWGLAAGGIGLPLGAAVGGVVGCVGNSGIGLIRIFFRDGN